MITHYEIETPGCLFVFLYHFFNDFFSILLVNANLHGVVVKAFSFFIMMISGRF